MSAKPIGKPTTVIVMLCLSVAVASSQTPSAGSELNPPRTFCYHGRPLDKCRVFPATELSFQLRMASNAPAPGLGHTFGHAVWDVGGLVNVGTRSAIGATLAPGIGDAGTQIALKLRYRHWLSDRSSAEAAFGMLRGKTHRGLGDGLTTEARVNRNDRYGAALRADWIATDFNGSAVALYGGGTLGTEATLAGSLVVGAAALIISLIAGLILSFGS